MQTLRIAMYIINRWQQNNVIWNETKRNSKTKKYKIVNCNNWMVQMAIKEEMQPTIKVVVNRVPRGGPVRPQQIVLVLLLLLIDQQQTRVLVRFMEIRLVCQLTVYLQTKPIKEIISTIHSRQRPRIPNYYSVHSRLFYFFIMISLIIRQSYFYFYLKNHHWKFHFFVEKI